MSIEQLAHIDSRENLFLNGLDPQEEEKKEAEKLFHCRDIAILAKITKQD